MTSTEENIIRTAYLSQLSHCTVMTALDCYLKGKISPVIPMTAIKTSLDNIYPFNMAYHEGLLNIAKKVVVKSFANTDTMEYNLRTMCYIAACVVHDVHYEPLPTLRENLTFWTNDEDFTEEIIQELMPYRDERE